MFSKLFKFLLFLLVLGFIGLVGFAYLGPFLGADFAEPETEIRIPVDLQPDQN